jgi:putative spermidine/putrescine transport system permease protein
LFVLFLYGPIFTILVLSFQGPSGGLTFPMNGMSTHWFSRLWDGLGVVDIWAAFGRSAKLGLAVMVLTVLRAGERFGVAWIADEFGTSAGMFTSGLGAHLTWTLPFGLLIMFAVFNRFDERFEEAARDLGATPWQTVRHVVLPIIAPSLVGIGLFGFTLSWDEVARSSQAFGSDQNTLPLELTGLTTTITNPEIYALGTVTTGVSLLMIAVSLMLIQALRRSRARRAPSSVE